jgi:thiamine biosynthesis lipoprotein
VRRVAGSTVWANHYGISDGATKGVMMLEPAELPLMIQKLQLQGVLFMEERGDLWISQRMRDQIKLIEPIADLRALHLIPD